MSISLKKRNPMERAVYQLREVARYLDENAERLIGDVDDTLDGGLRFSFEISSMAVPCVKVEHEHFALNKVDAVE